MTDNKVVCISPTCVCVLPAEWVNISDLKCLS